MLSETVRKGVRRFRQGLLLSNLKYHTLQIFYLLLPFDCLFALQKLSIAYFKQTVTITQQIGVMCLIITASTML